LREDKFVALQDWTLVDLTFGFVAASLHILSAFIPTKWKTVDGFTNPITPGNLPYIRSTQWTSIGGKREAGKSEENIMRTDVIELSFKTRSQYLRERNHQTVLSSGSIGILKEAGENNNNFVMGLVREADDIFPITDHRTWVEHGKWQYQSKSQKLPNKSNAQWYGMISQLRELSQNICTLHNQQLKPAFLPPVPTHNIFTRHHT
jgi:hypothetical protein